MFETDSQSPAAIARDRRRKILMFLLIAVLAAGAVLWIMST